MKTTIPGSKKRFIEVLERDRLYGGRYEDKFKIYYDVKQESQTSPRVPRTESSYLIPIHEENLYLWCLANLRNEITGCSIFFEFENLELTVSIAGDRLSQYAEIRDRVLELVRPFLLG